MAVQGLGDLRLPDPDKDRKLVRWTDGLTAPGRNGPPCERGTGVDAGDELPRSRALVVELENYGYVADAVGALPRRMWLVAAGLG